MKRDIPKLLPAGLLLLWATSALARSRFSDLNNQQHTIPNPATRATLLFFITQDCPIANSYAPEISRIIKEYSGQKVDAFIVYVDPSLTPAAARKHARDYGYYGAALLDAKHQLVKLCAATVTPEAALLSPTGKLLYHGRIDNRYAALGKPRTVANVHNLRDALSAVVRRRRVVHPVVPGFGCFIADLK